MALKEYKVLSNIGAPCDTNHTQNVSQAPKIKGRDDEYAVGQQIPVGEIIELDTEKHASAIERLTRLKAIRERMGYDDEAPEINADTTLEDLNGYNKKELIAIILAADVDVEKDEKELMKFSKPDLIDFIAETYNIGSKVEGGEK